MRGTLFFGTIVLVSLVGFAIASSAQASTDAQASAYASTVIGSDRGGNTDDYDDPNAVLGSPDPMTAGWPSGTEPVTIFRRGAPTRTTGARTRSSRSASAGTSR